MLPLYNMSDETHDVFMSAHVMISMKVSRSYVWHDSSTCFASVCTRGYFDVWHMNHTDACVETLCVRRNSSCG